MSLDIADVKDTLNKTFKVDVEMLESILILASDKLRDYKYDNIIIDRQSDVSIIATKIDIERQIKQINDSLTYVDDDIAPTNAKIKIEYCNY